MEPRVIKHILSAILIPSTTQVAIEWIVNEASTEIELTLGVLAAMPDDLSFMPILQSEDTKEGELRLIYQRRSLSLRSTIHRHPVRDGINVSDSPDGTCNPSFSCELYNADNRHWRSFDTAFPIDDILTILHKAPLETLHLELSALNANLVDWRALLQPPSQDDYLIAVSRIRTFHLPAYIFRSRHARRRAPRHF